MCIHNMYLCMYIFNPRFKSPLSASPRFIDKGFFPQDWVMAEVKRHQESAVLQR